MKENAVLRNMSILKNNFCVHELNEYVIKNNLYSKS